MQHHETVVVRQHDIEKDNIRLLLLYGRLDALPASHGGYPAAVRFQKISHIGLKPGVVIHQKNMNFDFFPFKDHCAPSRGIPRSMPP